MILLLSPNTKNMTYPVFSTDELDKGVAFLKKHRALELFEEFSIPEPWKSKRQVDCLDTFCIKSGAYLEIDDVVVSHSLDYDNLTYDLCFLVDTGSCYGAACYIYQLIEYVQKANDELEETLK